VVLSLLVDLNNAEMLRKSIVFVQAVLAFVLRLG